MSEDKEMEDLMKELEIEKPKEDEKAKPEIKHKWEEEEESESNITEAEFNKLSMDKRVKYGI